MIARAVVTLLSVALSVTLFAALAGCSTKTKLSELTEPRLDVRNWNDETLLELSWGAGRIECVRLPAATSARIDGVPMTVRSLGHPSMKTGESGLPYRNCPYQAFFTMPIPAGGAGESFVELSDGATTLRMRARAAFAPVRWSVPSGDVDVGDRLTVVLTPPSTEALDVTSVLFQREGQPTQEVPRNTIERTPGSMSFIVPSSWSGEGNLLVIGVAQAAITACDARACRVLPPQPRDIAPSRLRVGRSSAGRREIDRNLFETSATSMERPQPPIEKRAK